MNFKLKRPLVSIISVILAFVNLPGHLVSVISKNCGRAFPRQGKYSKYSGRSKIPKAVRDRKERFVSVNCIELK